jgi:hypothetical protein
MNLQSVRQTKVMLKYFIISAFSPKLIINTTPKQKNQDSGWYSRFFLLTLGKDGSHSGLDIL